MQQVNLYNGSLLPIPEKLPIKNLWIAIIIGFSLSAILWFVQWNGINGVRKQHHTLLSQQQKLQKQLLQLQQIIPTVEEKIIAENKIKKLQKQLQFQEKTAQLITALNQKQTAGYFGVLTNLSQLDKKNYWFTRIFLNTDHLSLEGKTFESAAVASMVSQLQLLPNTKNINFSKVIIEREKAKDRVANFYLYAAGEENSNER